MKDKPAYKTTVSPSVPPNCSAARYERVPFSSLKIGAIFYWRAAQFVKINGWEAEKTEHDSYTYANFGMVRVQK